MCTYKQLVSDDFQKWARIIKEPVGRYHRKIWEYCYIIKALSERGMLEPGKRGLGFAVGEEPLASLFCDRGVTVTASDMFPDLSTGGWKETGQHAAGLASINRRNICDPYTLEQNVTFRFVDMNNIPDDLAGYDFLWSCCSLEHLGSIEKGIRYVHNAMKCLKPGGWAVHTTEYNVLSNAWTIDDCGAVIFRQRDFIGMKRSLEKLGHTVTEFDFDPGQDPADVVVDYPPYQEKPHLKLLIQGHVATSIGMIIRKGV
jgi:SAM-dependent methyltransferase